MNTQYPPHRQVARQVVLVRPSGFRYSADTAATNGFQQDATPPDMQRKVEREFQALQDALAQHGIGFTVLDPADPAAPDAVFPNNWFSTHDDGRIVLYPMATASRRSERDPGLAEKLSHAGFTSNGLLDLSGMEQRGLALEGTGSLVLDRKARLAFAALSPRTHQEALEAWCLEMKYRAIPFAATMDGTTHGQPVYHTNVVMSIGEDFALACMEALPDLNARHIVAAELARAGKELIQISLRQMHAFAGNILQLRSGTGAFIFLSDQARRSLEFEQARALGRHGELVPVAVPTIEALGGGSIRCMLAENFLPLRP